MHQALSFGVPANRQRQACLGLPPSWQWARVPSGPGQVNMEKRCPREVTQTNLSKPCAPTLVQLTERCRGSTGSDSRRQICANKKDKQKPDNVLFSLKLTLNTAVCSQPHMVSQEPSNPYDKKIIAKKKISENFRARASLH